MKVQKSIYHASGSSRPSLLFAEVKADFHSSSSFFFKRTTAPSAKPPPVSSPSLFVSPRPWRRVLSRLFFPLVAPAVLPRRANARVCVCVQLCVPSCRYCGRRCCVAETSGLLFLQVAARRGPASPCVYSSLGLLPPDDKERLMNK